MKIVYLDPALLCNEDSVETARPNPEVVLAVRRAIKRLTATQREIAEARFIQCLTFEQIASQLGLTKRAVRSEYSAAMQALKLQLAPFVRKRWHIEVNSLCRVCSHSKRGEIERMLRTKGGDETWGAFGRRLERVIGVRICPPRLLIIHLKHMGDQ